jgi:hypothetical protein
LARCRTHPPLAAPVLSGPRAVRAARGPARSWRRTRPLAAKAAQVTEVLHRLTRAAGDAHQGRPGASHPVRQFRTVPGAKAPHGPRVCHGPAPQLPAARAAPAAAGEDRGRWNVSPVRHALCS